MFSVVEKVYEAYQNDIRTSPCRSNRASQLGHPCERCLVYWRTRWEKARLITPQTKMIFEAGNMIESLAKFELERAGFKITNQQRDFEDKKNQITGHVDFFLSSNGKDAVPCEVKGINHFSFMAINTTEDMLKSKQVWMRKYPAQLQLYLYLASIEEGLFYFKDKQTMQPKEIWMKLDYEFAESLLKKAERINKHVEDQTLPDRVSDLSVCEYCEFNHICLPPTTSSSVDFMLNHEREEWEQNLQRWDQLKPTAKEFQDMDKQIKAFFKEKPDTIVGDFMIKHKETEKNIKAKEACVQKIIQVLITKVGE